MSGRRLLHDLEVIRRALETAERSNAAVAARDVGVTHKTIVRWVRMRATLGPQWPTDDDIAAWRADDEQHRAERVRRAQQQREYRIAHYLARGPIQLDPLSTTRRLQALYAIGWTQPSMANYLGISTSRVGHLMNGAWKKLHPSTVKSVAAMYEALCMTVPQDNPTTTRGKVRVHERARADARRRGYTPPLGWDDIENPKERPRKGSNKRPKTSIDHATIERLLAGERLDSSPAEKEEVVRRWLASGRTLRDLERQLGWKPERYYEVPTDEAAAS